LNGSIDHFLCCVAQDKRCTYKREAASEPKASSWTKGSYQRHVGRDYLDHGNLLARVAVAHRVHHMRRLERQQASLCVVVRSATVLVTPHIHTGPTSTQAVLYLLDFDAREGEVLLNDSVLDQGSPERDPLRYTDSHGMQHTLGKTHHAHAVMNTSGTQAGLSHFEPFACIR
jgi:hypothetical protein